MDFRYIPRDLEGRLLKYLESPEILIVLGPRQSGKSTLIHHIFDRLSNSNRISLEDVDVLATFESDVKAFYELHVKGYRYVFIDEVQYASSFGKHMKYMFDLVGGKVKFFITGSSVTDFYLNGLPYLVGRAFTFYLYPFSFGEFLRAKDEKLISLVHKSAVRPRVQRLLEEFVVYGGYPRVALSDDPEEKKLILKNLYNLLVQREITTLAGLLNHQHVVSLIRLLAVYGAKLINYTTLAKESGLKYPEVKRLLSLFQKTFIVELLQPFYTNKKLEIMKNPKLYFIDNGLRNAILNDFSTLRADMGILYESFVFQELLKQGLSVHFWRTKGKAEVDFVIRQDGQTIPVEVKMRHPAITRSLRAFVERYSPPVGFIFNLEEQERVLAGKTVVEKQHFGEIIHFQEYLKNALSPKLPNSG